MEPLKGFQKKYLRGLAHDLKPIVLIGKEGLVRGVIKAAAEGLDRHELIKVKFNDFKEKEQKEELTAELVTKTDSEVVGMIGHTVILYRQQPDPEKRKIAVPTREGAKKKTGVRKTTGV
ncbi:MAG: ribosome assembly RNA-binding protein YhbY [Deltaproteobacteria bacterium]|nr:ribosome assembly RNA-binding protein YhbY [Deltaproteobacteria bacterium]